MTAAETVQTVYDNFGNPVYIASGYVTNTVFNGDGTIASRTLGTNATGYSIKRGYQWDPARGQLVGLYAEKIKTGVPTVPIQDLAYTYDTAGNVKSITDNIVDSTNSLQGECFGYDTRNRLTAAFTTSAVTPQPWAWDTTGAYPTRATLPSTNCGAANGGGASPYSLAYGFTARNRFTTGPAGTYTYGSGAHPDAPTSIVTAGGTDTYTYDPAGNRTSFTDANGPDYTYQWDSLGRLAASTASGGATGTTMNLYDTDRQRIMRKDPDGTVTLYLAGKVEVVRNPTAATGVVSAKRFYAIGSTTVAYKINATTTAATHFILGEAQGSASVTVGRSSGTVATQEYLPYGQTRGPGFGTGGANPADHGFLNQVKDTTTGLNYLNNRYMDPATGTFLSVDPLVASTGTPYLYGNGNPTTFSDPSGLDSNSDRSCVATSCFVPKYGPPSPKNQGLKCPPHCGGTSTAAVGRGRESGANVASFAQLSAAIQSGAVVRERAVDLPSHYLKLNGSLNRLDTKVFEPSALEQLAGIPSKGISDGLGLGLSISGETVELLAFYGDMSHGILTGVDEFSDSSWETVRGYVVKRSSSVTVGLSINSGQINAGDPSQQSDYENPLTSWLATTSKSVDYEVYIYERGSGVASTFPVDNVFQILVRDWRPS